MHPTARALRYFGINTILLPLNLGVAWVLTATGIHYLPATALGFTLQFVVAFILNRKYTFRSLDLPLSWALLQTALIGLGGIAIVLAFTSVGVEILGLPFLLVRLSASLLAGLWYYTMDSLVTFKISPFT